MVSCNLEVYHKVQAWRIYTVDVQAILAFLDLSMLDFYSLNHALLIQMGFLCL